MPETDFTKLQEVPSHFLDDLQHKLHALMKPGLIGSADLLEPSISGGDTIQVSAIPTGEAVVSDHTWMSELKATSYQFTTEDSGTYVIHIGSYLAGSDGNDPYYQAELKVIGATPDPTRYLIIGEVDWNGTVLSNLVDKRAGKTDVAHYPRGFISGGATYRATTDTVKIPPGQFRSDDDSADINVISELTVDKTAEGAGGLDHSTPADTSTWYYIWVVMNPLTGAVAGLLSKSSTSPTLPGTYTKKVRVGSVYNASGGNFREYYSHGAGRDKTVFYALSFAFHTGSLGSASWTEMDVSDYVPETADVGIVNCDGANGATDRKIVWRPEGSSNTGAVLGYSADGRLNTRELTIIDQKFEAKSSVAAADVDLTMEGYIDRL